MGRRVRLWPLPDHLQLGLSQSLGLALAPASRRPGQPLDATPGTTQDNVFVDMGNLGKEMNLPFDKSKGVAAPCFPCVGTTSYPSFEWLIKGVVPNPCSLWVLFRQRGPNRTLRQPPWRPVDDFPTQPSHWLAQSASSPPCRHSAQWPGPSPIRTPDAGPIDLSGARYLRTSRSRRSTRFHAGAGAV